MFPSCRKTFIVTGRFVSIRKKLFCQKRCSLSKYYAAIDYLIPLSGCWVKFKLRFILQATAAAVPSTLDVGRDTDTTVSKIQCTMPQKGRSLDISFGEKTTPRYSGEIKSVPLWIWNGRKEVDLQMVQFQMVLEIWSLTIWNLNKWLPFCQKPFEFWTKTFWFLNGPFLKGIIAIALAQPFKNWTLWN